MEIRSAMLESSTQLAVETAMPALKPQPVDPMCDPAVVNGKLSRARSSQLYKIIWRWHFYAGLLTVPVMWIVTLTGVLYVFRTELSEWRDHALLRVPVLAERQSHEQLRTVAEAALGTTDLEAVVVSPDSTRSMQFVAHLEDPAGDHAQEVHQLIYLDPYTGNVLGKRVVEEDIFHTILELHRTLLLGTTGRVLVELTTCWSVLLLATGIYLWWPRGKKNTGVWLPRVRGKLYAILRDWHAVIGAYMVPLMALVAVTGLVFSQVLGMTFNNTAKQVGHWPQKEWFAPFKSKPAPPGTTPATLDTIVSNTLAHARPDDVARIRLATKPDLSHRAFLMRDEDKNSLKTLDIDQYTGKVLRIVEPPDLKLMYRIRLWSVSIHMGQIFGLPTKILAFITALVMFALSFTGIWMWWVRRPTGRTGFPRRPLPRSFPLWGWSVIAVSGVLLPVAGISFLIFGAIDLLFGWARGKKN